MICRINHPDIACSHVWHVSACYGIVMEVDRTGLQKAVDEALVMHILPLADRGHTCEQAVCVRVVGKLPCQFLEVREACVVSNPVLRLVGQVWEEVSSVDVPVFVCVSSVSFHSIEVIPNGAILDRKLGCIFYVLNDRIHHRVAFLSLRVCEVIPVQQED